MTPDALTRYLVEIVDDVHVDDTTGDMVDVLGADRMRPFATLVTRDNDFDRVSQRDRPGVYRLNVGVSPATWQAMPPRRPQAATSTSSPSPNRDLASSWERSPIDGVTRIG